MATNAAIKIETSPARRRLILVLGGGKSGKTLWVRWLRETMRARGIRPLEADAGSVWRGIFYEKGGLRSSGWDPTSSDPIVVGQQLSGVVSSG